MQTQRVDTTRRDFLGSAVSAAGMLAVPWLGLAAAGRVVLEPDQRQRIEAAIPTKAIIRPRKARRLLIFDLNVGYGGHRSIPTANLAFKLMGAKTGAFETVVSRNPSVFKPESLRRFDAVFLNNTVGNLFEEPELRQSLLEFVYGGGGLLGVHGTSVAFTRWPGAHEDWPEFGIMLGARGANHRDSDEHVFIKLDDPNHPLNQPFGGKGFEYADEFFRFHGPYSRHRVRVLFSIDTDKTDFQGKPRGNCFREDSDYALAWVRQYGRGRVFYCTIAHNPYVFWDPKMLQFYLAAAQFTLGDLPAPTIPSGKLTPAIRAQEQLGWRLGLTPPTSYSFGFFPRFSLFGAIDRTAKLGLLYYTPANFQTVRREIPNIFSEQLSSDEMKQIRLKLDSVGVRLLDFRLDVIGIPTDETHWRKIFEFGWKMGIETFVANPPLNELDIIEKLCEEYDIKFAIAGRDKHLQELLKVCRGRNKRIGVCGKLASWKQAGINPVEAVRTIRDRLFILHIQALNEPTEMSSLLREIHRLDLKPLTFSFEHAHLPAASVPGIAKNIEFFNKVSVKLAK